MLIITLRYLIKMRRMWTSNRVFKFHTNEVEFDTRNRNCTVDKESIPEYHCHLRCSPNNPGFGETAPKYSKKN